MHSLSQLLGDACMSEPWDACVHFSRVTPCLSPCPWDSTFLPEGIEGLVFESILTQTQELAQATHAPHQREVKNGHLTPDHVSQESITLTSLCSLQSFVHFTDWELKSFQPKRRIMRGMSGPGVSSSNSCFLDMCCPCATTCGSPSKVPGCRLCTAPPRDCLTPHG